MSARRSKRTGPIDWTEVRARLAQAAAAGEAILNPPPERQREILGERARTLARPPAPLAPPAGEIEVVTFSLGHELYAIESAYAREVLRLPPLTLIPGIAEVIAGVVNHHGGIVPIMDLRLLLGVATEGLGEPSWVVMLGRERTEFGVLAHAVRALARISRDELKPPPEEVEFRLGTTRDAMIVLDGAALIEDRRLFINGGEGKPPRHSGGG
jgi:purine-binding chemotaxis protein CheW